MAHDAGDRTEAPTPRRRTEARERGQVARSTDLSSAILLLGGILVLRGVGPRLMAALEEAMRQHLAMSDARSASRLDFVPILMAAGMSVLAALGPVLVGLLVLSLASNILQVGFLFTTTPLEPSLNRLNPLAGLGRVFTVRTLMQLAMNVVKLVLVVAVAWGSLQARMGQILVAMDTGGWQQAALLAQVGYDLAIRLALVLLVIGLLDYAWQRWRLEKDLRMTKEEVREELRRMEGDPLIKQRRRKMQFVQLMQQIKKHVPKADVVVTNPTELAVAIQYEAGEMRAPKVVAKGQDYIAQKIREIAAAHGVPIVERKPLAQALYKMVDVGQEIPEHLYQAIAEVLAYVYQLSGKAKKPAA